MKKLVIKIVIAIIAFILVFFISARYIGTKGLNIKEYKIVNSKINADYHGLKIVHLSDIHYGSIIFEKELNNIVEKINLIGPDIVVLTGDVIDERIKADNEILINYLSKINTKLGKYAISGNHDMPIETFNEIIERSGFINLNNDYTLIYNGNEPIMLSGISSYSDKIDTNIKVSKTDEFLGSNEVLYSILLLHEPDLVDDLNLNNYDLILAGHSHGGQVKIPFYQLGLPVKAKKYYKEYYNVNNTDLYISSGLGTSGYRLRLFDKPSFNFYRITNK